MYLCWSLMSINNCACEMRSDQTSCCPRWTDWYCIFSVLKDDLTMSRVVQQLQGHHSGYNPIHWHTGTMIRCQSAFQLAISWPLWNENLFSNRDFSEMRKYFYKRFSLHQSYVQGQLRFKILFESNAWARNTIQSRPKLYFWHSR